MKKRSKRPARKHPSSAGQAARPANNLRVVLTEKQIQRRVRQLAEQMNRDYKGKTVHVVGILENCFMFMSDLVRALKVPVICHFVKAEIRDTAAGVVPVREIMYTPKVEATGREVLLVDGILQSGVTLDHLYRYVLGQNPSSVRTASLIEKTDERKVDVATDYVGFKVDFKTTGKFLVGYGLGYQEKYRNLPCISTLG